MTTKYTKDGYIPGAGPEMAKVMKLYKRSHLCKSSGVSWFFLKNYTESQPVPPSIKKKIIQHMRKQMKILENAIKIEEQSLKE